MFGSIWAMESKIKAFSRFALASKINGALRGHVVTWGVSPRMTPTGFVQAHHAARTPMLVLPMTYGEFG